MDTGPVSVSVAPFLASVALNARSPGLTSRHALPLRMIVPRFVGTPSTFVLGLGMGGTIAQFVQNSTVAP